MSRSSRRARIIPRWNIYEHNQPIYNKVTSTLLSPHHEEAIRALHFVLPAYDIIFMHQIRGEEGGWRAADRSIDYLRKFNSGVKRIVTSLCIAIKYLK